MKSFCFIVVLTFSSIAAIASDPRVDSLKKLGRDSLIAMAIKKMDEPKFDPKSYDRVVVKAYENKLVVEFSSSFVFRSRWRCYYEHLSVALVGSGTGGSGDGNCWGDQHYIKRNRKFNRREKFIFKAINRSDKVGDIPNNKLPAGTSMNAKKHWFHYHVETRSWSSASFFRVNRITGHISKAGHKHFARRGREEEPKYEIVQ